MMRVREGGSGEAPGHVPWWTCCSGKAGFWSHTGVYLYWPWVAPVASCRSLCLTLTLVFFLRMPALEVAVRSNVMGTEGEGAEAVREARSSTVADDDDDAPPTPVRLIVEPPPRAPREVEEREEEAAAVAEEAMSASSSASLSRLRDVEEDAEEERLAG